MGIPLDVSSINYEEKFFGKFQLYSKTFKIFINIALFIPQNDYYFYSFISKMIITFIHSLSLKFLHFRLILYKKIQIIIKVLHNINFLIFFTEV